MLSLQEFLGETNKLADAKQFSSLADLVEISKWCKGLIEEFDGTTYIQVDVDSHGVHAAEMRAFYTDWVLFNGKSYRVTKDEEYRQIYAEAGKHREEFKAVLKLVKLAMLEQDSASYHQNRADMALVAEDTAIKILDLFYKSKGSSVDRS
jgi:hypothetical protein